MGDCCHHCESDEDTVRPDGTIEPHLCSFCRGWAEAKSLTMTLERLAACLSLQSQEAWLMKNDTTARALRILADEARRGLANAKANK